MSHSGDQDRPQQQQLFVSSATKQSPSPSHTTYSIVTGDPLQRSTTTTTRTNTTTQGYHHHNPPSYHYSQVQEQQNATFTMNNNSHNINNNLYADDGINHSPPQRTAVPHHHHRPSNSDYNNNYNNHNNNHNNHNSNEMTNRSTTTTLDYPYNTHNFIPTHLLYQPPSPNSTLSSLSSNSKNPQNPMIPTMTAVDRTMNFTNSAQLSSSSIISSSSSSSSTSSSSTTSTSRTTTNTIATTNSPSSLLFVNNHCFNSSDQSTPISPPIISRPLATEIVNGPAAIVERLGPHENNNNNDNNNDNDNDNTPISQMSQEQLRLYLSGHGNIRLPQQQQYHHRNQHHQGTKRDTKGEDHVRARAASNVSTTTTTTTTSLTKDNTLSSMNDETLDTMMTEATIEEWPSTGQTPVLPIPPSLFLASLFTTEKIYPLHMMSTLAMSCYQPSTSTTSTQESQSASTTSSSNNQGGGGGEKLLVNHHNHTNNNDSHVIQEAITKIATVTIDNCTYTLDLTNPVIVAESLEDLLSEGSFQATDQSLQRNQQLIATATPLIHHATSVNVNNVNNVNNTHNLNNRNNSSSNDSSRIVQPTILISQPQTFPSQSERQQNSLLSTPSSADSTSQMFTFTSNSLASPGVLTTPTTMIGRLTLSPLPNQTPAMTTSPQPDAIQSGDMGTSNRKRRGNRQSSSHSRGSSADGREEQLFPPDTEELKFHVYNPNVRTRKKRVPNRQYRTASGDQQDMGTSSTDNQTRSNSSNISSNNKSESL